MSFCFQCGTYLASDTSVCPACGTPQPPAEPLVALWSAEMGGPPTGPPLVAGHLLLVPSQQSDPSPQSSRLHALNLADGDRRWDRSFGYVSISGLAIAQTPKVSKTFGVSVLVSLSSTDLLRGEGVLLALDLEGEEHWHWAPGVQRVSAPAVIGNTVCVTADADQLIVLNRATGQERTRVELEVGASLAAPALADGVGLIPCRGPHLVAVGLDGEPRWHYTLEDEPDAWLDQTPALVGGYCLVALSTGVILTLRVEDGSLAWRAQVGPSGKRLSPPATDGQRLYVGARDGLHALDLGNGHEVWVFPTERGIKAAPVAERGVIYVACRDHYLYALDATTGHELWRYQVRRRIEISPAVAACGQPAASCVIVADRGGSLAAVARPLSAEEHQAAGDWVEAALAYAARGQFATGAELLETHGQPLKAAELWKKAGELGRAATQYEAAWAWAQAADLWGALQESLKQAEALEKNAQSLEDGSASDGERADAWAAAAQAFEAQGELQRAAACQREVARWLKQPIITLDVEHGGLVLEAWSRLQFMVRNQGYGPARNLVIRASGDQFGGQVMATQQIVTLPAGRDHAAQLDVRPLQHGDSVPLRVTVEYQDQAGGPCTCEQTVYISVAQTEKDRGSGQVFHINTGGGAVVLGDVSVDGDFVGRDVVAGADTGPAAHPSLPGTTHLLSFDKLSPIDFERLCLWLVEREGFVRGEHLGLAGSEQGRDVVAYKPTPDGEELWYFQCKRYKSIGAKMLTDEVDKYLELAKKKPHLRPIGVVFVVSCALSAKVREEVSVYCDQHDLVSEYWALTELDMRVKRHPDLLREFFNLAPPPAGP